MAKMNAIEETERKVTGFLKLISGPNEGHSFEMYGAEMLLGRNSTAPICLSHRSVSRNHCIFRCESEVWSVRDNKSQNGTFINDIKIGAKEFHPIKDGDCIYLGNPVIPECLALLFQKHKHENLPGNQEVSPLSPEEVEKVDQSAKSNNNFNIPYRNDLKRQLDDKLEQNKKNCTGADQMNVNSTNLPSTLAAFHLSSTKKSHNSAMVNRLHNQRKNESSQKFMEFLHELKAKSPEKIIEMPGDIMIDSSVSLIGAECEVTDMDFSYSPSEDVYLNEANIDTPIVKQAELTSDFSQELSKVQELQDKVSCLEADLEKVKRELLEKNELLKAQMQKQEELEKNIPSRIQCAVDDFYARARETVEEELICNICTELLLKATVLGCSHTFCEYCINEWKKKKRQCPNCREPISIQYKVLLIDNFIDKLAISYNPEMVEKRKELLKARSEKNEGNKKKRKSKRSFNTRVQRTRTRSQIASSTSASENSNSGVNALSLLEERVDDILRHNLLEPSLPEIQEILISSDFSSQSASEESVDGYGYGGYGRCFNCGRRGHWANGCPYF